MHEGSEPTRRRVLAGLGAAGAGALAGCLSRAGPPDATVSVDRGGARPLSFALGYDVDPRGWPGGGDDPAVRSVVADANATVLRFPADPLGTLYDWRDDRYLRAPLERPPADLLDRGDFPDRGAYRTAVEALAAVRDDLRATPSATDDRRGEAGFDACRRLTDAAGLERLLVCNLATAPDGADPADHAADWVRDLADRGVRVERFQLGTGVGGPLARYGDLDDPATLAARAERVAAVVRERFPAATVGIAVAPPGSGTDDDTAAVAPGAEVADAVATPTSVRAGYTRAGEPRPTSSGGRRVARRRGLRSAVATSTAMADDLAAVAPDRPAWLTDAGVVVPPTHRGTVLATLVEARALLAWLGRDDVVDLHSRRRLFGPAGTVAVAGDGTTVARPTYHARGLVGEGLATATHVLPVSVTATATPGATATPEPWRSVAMRALLDDRTGRLYLPFVNPVGERRRIEVGVDGGLPSGGRLSGQWVAGEPGDRNTTATPGAVTPGISSVGVVGGTATLTVPAFAAGTLFVDLE